jgi:hypothetical protein
VKGEATYGSRTTGGHCQCDMRRDSSHCHTGCSATGRAEEAQFEPSRAQSTGNKVQCTSPAIQGAICTEQASNGRISTASAMRNKRKEKLASLCRRQGPNSRRRCQLPVRRATPNGPRGFRPSLPSRQTPNQSCLQAQWSSSEVQPQARRQAARHCLQVPTNELMKSSSPCVVTCNQNGTALSTNFPNHVETHIRQVSSCRKSRNASIVPGQQLTNQQVRVPSVVKVVFKQKSNSIHSANRTKPPHSIPVVSLTSITRFTVPEPPLLLAVTM